MGEGPILSEDETPRRHTAPTYVKSENIASKFSSPASSEQLDDIFYVPAKEISDFLGTRLPLTTGERATSSENFRRFEKASIRAKESRRLVRDFVFAASEQRLARFC